MKEGGVVARGAVVATANARLKGTAGAGYTAVLALFGPNNILILHLTADKWVGGVVRLRSQ